MDSKESMGNEIAWLQAENEPRMKRNTEKISEREKGLTNRRMWRGIRGKMSKIWSTHVMPPTPLCLEQNERMEVRAHVCSQPRAPVHHPSNLQITSEEEDTREGTLQRRFPKTRAHNKDHNGLLQWIGKGILCHAEVLGYLVSFCLIAQMSCADRWKWRDRKTWDNKSKM